MLYLQAQAALAETTAAWLRSSVFAATYMVSASASYVLTRWCELLSANGSRPAPNLTRGFSLRPRDETAHAAVAHWREPGAFNARSETWGTPASMLGRWADVPDAGWPGPALALCAPLLVWTAWNRACLAAWSDELPYEVSMIPMAAEAGAVFSSYRSSGGHAVAPLTEAVLAGLTATAALGQLLFVLGGWQSAPGA